MQSTDQTTFPMGSTCVVWNTLQRKPPLCWWLQLMPQPMVQSKVPHYWVPLTEPGTGKELEVIYTSGEIQQSSLNTWLPCIQQEYMFPGHIPTFPYVKQRYFPVEDSRKGSCSSKNTGEWPKPSDPSAGGWQEKATFSWPWYGNLGIYLRRTDPPGIFHLEINEMPETSRLYLIL